jgi:peptidyl-tRNA hydrolase
VPSAIKLIVGLGNPGSEYSGTRHNAGFWFVDVLAARFSLKFRTEAKFQSEVCRIDTPEYDCLLGKPMTFMNRSGYAVSAIANFYKIPVIEILVVHDEIDLDAGIVRLKQGGGHGGHNGLRDIIEQMGNSDFKRLRIGISHPGSREYVTPHVLSSPNGDDHALIMDAINRSMDIIPQILGGEFQKAMNKLHRSEKLKIESEKNEDKE